MAVGAVAGIMGAIGLAKEVIGGIASLFDDVTDGLTGVLEKRISPEEFAEKMTQVNARVKAAKDILGPLVDESREKDVDLDKGWDKRLIE